MLCHFLQVREYTDPTCDALLPELAPEVRGHVKTLVLDLEDVLVHKEWSRAKGWQVRPSEGGPWCRVCMLVAGGCTCGGCTCGSGGESCCSQDQGHRCATWRVWVWVCVWGGGVACALG
jgi:hypothetical protein